jgi:hypothetical protein
MLLRSQNFLSGMNISQLSSSIYHLYVNQRSIYPRDIITSRSFQFVLWARCVDCLSTSRKHSVITCINFSKLFTLRSSLGATMTHNHKLHLTWKYRKNCENKHFMSFKHIFIWSAHFKQNFIAFAKSRLCWLELEFFVWQLVVFWIFCSWICCKEVNIW